MAAFGGLKGEAALPSCTNIASETTHFSFFTSEATSIFTIHSDKKLGPGLTEPSFLVVWDQSMER